LASSNFTDDFAKIADSVVSFLAVLLTPPAEVTVSTFVTAKSGLSKKSNSSSTAGVASAG
jgi:hypothetical protein